MTEPGKEDLRLDKKLADAMEKAIQQTLNDTFRMETRMGSWSVEAGPVSLDPYILCQIEMRQDDKSLGSFVLGFSHETIMKVLAQYGLTESNGDQQVVDDAAQELTNIIYGTVKTALNKVGGQLVMEIPSSIHDKKGVNERFSKLQKMILPFWTDGSRCNAIVAKTPPIH